MYKPICEAMMVDEQGRELVEHGTALFPIAAYHDNLMFEDVPWHWHDEFEAAVVTEGTAVFATDRERVSLKTGDGCFINVNALHGAWNPEKGEACRLHSLVFHPRLLGGSAESVFWQKYLLPVMENSAFQIIPLHTETDAAPLACIERAWRACAEEPPGFEFQVRSELSRMFLAVCDRIPVSGERLNEKRLRTEQRMKAMLAYIRANLANTLTVGDIAAAAAVSGSECIRSFRRLTGTTPIRYVLQLRLQTAAEMLQDTDEKIAEIGAACGFQEMGYFAKAFRREYGVTPSAYRREHGPQSNEKR